jgi:hypothetical protein
MGVFSYKTGNRAIIVASRLNNYEKRNDKAKQLRSKHEIKAKNSRIQNKIAQNANQMV